MNIHDFFRKYDGKALDKDGAYGAQCMDLYNAYQEEVLGRQAVGAPYAMDVWNKDMYNKDLFYKIENTNDFVPKLGDVAVWNGSSSAVPYGHISICTGEGDINIFRSFDQNWGGAYCHYVTHNYFDGFKGVLRPKDSSAFEEENLDRYNHSVGQLVVYSSCYRSSNAPFDEHIDCISAYGAWQQQYITEIVAGKNPYKLSNGMYVNDGDIREVK